MAQEMAEERKERLPGNRSIKKDLWARVDEMLREYRDRMSRPYLMGRDLIEAGVSPGPVFSRALDYAHKLRLAGIPKEEQLRQTLGMIRKRDRDEG